MVCGLIYAIISPPQPIIRPAAKETPSRSLAYEEMIGRSGATEQKPAAETENETQAMAPASPAPASPAPVQSAPVPQDEAAATQPQQPPQNEAPDMAGLPPDEGGEPSDPNALPWQQGAAPYDPARPEPGMSPPGADQGEGYQGGYQQGAAPLPGEEVDPNAWPSGPQGEPEEWVQVLVSGAGMHGVASEQAPMLFAFPYGRRLRVISRYGNWVEVTDPQSAATGWMQAQYLAPVAAPNAQQEAEAWSQEEPRRRRRGLFGGIFGRAFGGF